MTHMRKAIWILSSIVLVSCAEGAAPELPASIAIQPGSAMLDAIGRTAPLGTKVMSESGSEMQVTGISWTTSAPAVATVDGDGKITAVGEGDATITATLSESIKSTAAVSVRATIALSISLQSMQNAVTDQTKTSAAASVVVNAAP